MKKIILLASTLAVLAAATLPVCADAPATASAATGPMAADKDADPWQFSATPYLWVVQINGNVKILGRKANVNVDFDQIFNHLEGPPLMLNLEVRKKEYGFYTAPLYVKLSADANTSVGPVNVGGDDTLTLWIVESGGFLQLGKVGEERPLTIDGLAGVRYWSVNNDLSFSASHNTIGFDFKRTKYMSLWDPFLGLRLKKYLTDKLSVTVLGEGGGFGISRDTPEYSWQALGIVGYDFTRSFSVMAGYRALGLNTYNRNDKGDLQADLVLQGAVVGFQFRF